ncbi:hypothetical protein [Dolichospermum sp. UHCC 0259]|uniref:hypothetical protein n=1 Tax=Dolichospermum sp. UHCC 0259 TaxID=2590010 RepID=UPI001445B48A|nr:hypothetical protein [Dolichospermum sp. UHCC 0259]MTJ49665.1 hypothetical protein [Dolichospermum sp. UHCC 0259]
MSELLTADISIEINGTTYEGRYTVNMKHQLLTVISDYGTETTYTSIPSDMQTPLERNKGIAMRVFREIVDKSLEETRKGYK